MGLGVHMLLCVETKDNLSSPSTMWISGIEHRLSALAASTFTHRAV